MSIDRIISEYKRLGNMDKVSAELNLPRSFVRETIQAYRDALSEGGSNDPVRASVDFMAELRKSLGSGKPMTPLKASTTDGETMVVVLADWHFGSMEKDSMGNITYSLRVARDRADLMCRKILSLASKHITMGTKIGDIAVLVAGDMVDGEGIFEGQSYQIECAPPQQVLEVVKTMRDFILGLKALNLPINIYAVKGNHGRVGKKDMSPQSNWDLMVYMILEDWIKTSDIKGVALIASNTDYLNVDIRGWKYNLRHKGLASAETPSGASKLAGWASLHSCDAVVCGHLHHFSINESLNKLIIMSGSLKGVDDFSESIAKGCHPSQVVFGVTKSHLITFQYRVDLE